jgi:hypothetical protein
VQVGAAGLDERDQHLVQHGQVARAGRGRVNRFRLRRYLVVERVHELHRQSRREV